MSQDEIWVTSNGEHIFVSQMTDRHVLNTVRFLLKRKGQLHRMPNYASTAREMLCGMIRRRKKEKRDRRYGGVGVLTPMMFRTYYKA